MKPAGLGGVLNVQADVLQISFQYGNKCLCEFCLPMYKRVFVTSVRYTKFTCPKCTVFGMEILLNGLYRS
jgi:hypothetical protein